MGTQGEIYNVLGVKLPAKEVSKKGIYDVSGMKVAIDDLVDEPHDFTHGIYFDGVNPTLSVYLLGYDSNLGMEDRHFKGQALVGYAVANESYMNSATKLPDMEQIKKLKDKLVLDLYQQTGGRFNPNEIGLYLLFDFVN